MSLSQGLYQKQLQKLSPQQIQLMKLLQIPTANLEERIKEEIEENPALEEDEEGHEDEYSEVNDEFKDKDEDDFEPDGSAEEYDNIDISEYVKEGDDDVGDYKLRDDNYPEEDETRQSPHKVETGFNELMVEQLGMLNLDEHNHKVAEQIIGNLDDDGYLRRAISSIVDDLAFRQNIITTDEEIGKLVLQIQQFEPPGIAARNLQECLLLQLERKKDESKAVQLAMKVLEKYFEEFTKKHYEKIQRGLGITDEQLKEVINQIIKLNPKPGGNIGAVNKAETYVIPDFFIFNNAGKLVGVNTMIFGQGQNLNFSVAVDEVQELIKNKSQFSKKTNTTISSDQKSKNPISQKFPDAKEGSSKKDGIIDIWYLKNKETGKYDRAFVDLKRRGLIDGLLVDANGKGKWTHLYLDEEKVGYWTHVVIFDGNGKTEYVGTLNRNGTINNLEKVS